MTPIISILNLQMGTGKSSLSTQLCRSLAYAGNSVLLVDLDPNGGASSRLGSVRQRSGLFGRILKGEGTDDRLGVLIRSTEPGVDLIPGDETPLSTKGIDSSQLRMHLDEVSTPYRYIILDLPPLDFDLCGLATVVSDLLLVPLLVRQLNHELVAQWSKVAGFPFDDARLERVRIVPVVEFGGDQREVLQLQSWRAESRIKTLTSTIIRDESSIDRVSDTIDRTLELPSTRGYLRIAKEIMTHDRTQTGART